jgi:hypothetical protein
VYGLSQPAKFRWLKISCSLQQQARQKSNASPKTLDRDQAQPRKDHEMKQIRGGDISYQYQALDRFDPADGATKRNADVVLILRK